MKYELLQEGEIIKEGDECLDENRLWVKARSFGTQTSRWSIHRRHVPTKPKVSLEDLVKVALEAYNVEKCQHYTDKVTNITKSICAHLGLELEPEKEEWEAALEDYMTFGSTTLEPTKIDRNIAKAMFEAGQRSKEK